MAHAGLLQRKPGASARESGGGCDRLRDTVGADPGGLGADREAG